MIAIIEDEVFGDPDPGIQLAIHHILRLGFRERHYVQTEPLFEADGTREVNRWLARQDRSIHEAFEQVMESGFAIETTGLAPRPLQRIRVATVESSYWDLVEPRLPVEVACRLLETPLRLLVENSRNDGHQRVTTLFTALGPGLLPSEEGSQDTALIADDDDDYRDIRSIYFDLEEKEFVLEPKRGQSKPTWLPLAILFDDLQMYEFQEQLAKNTTGRERPLLVNRARNLHRTFYDYSIAVVPIIADDLDLVTKSFERVNSAGTPLSEVHMVSALTYIKGFDLNERVQEIRSEIGEVGWQDLEDKMILNICKARLSVDIHGKSIKSLVAKLKKEPKLLDDAKDAIVLAAEFLADWCGIQGPQTLPYSYQIVLLADVLWRHKGGSKKINEPLAEWFWITTYGEYFANMTSSR